MNPYIVEPALPGELPPLPDVQAESLEPLPGMDDYIPLEGQPVEGPNVMRGIPRQINTQEEYDALPQWMKDAIIMQANGVQIMEADLTKMAMDGMRMEREMQQKAMESQAAAAAQQEELRFGIGTMKSLIDEMEKHPGLPGSVGAQNWAYAFGAKSQPFAATKEADFFTMLEQLKGGVFMQAYEKLRGSGQITEIEAEKAEKALARLSTLQSEEGFKKSLSDFRQFLDAAEARLTPAEKREMERRQQAGDPAGQPAATPAQSAPQGPTAPASVPAAPVSAGQGRALPPERFIGGVKFILNDKGKYVRAN